MMLFFFCHLFYSPSLSWRDVQHVIVRSARPAPGRVLLESGAWVKNKAGLVVSKFFGFGLMDAGKMVHLAEQWNRVPKQQRCVIRGQDQNRFAFCVFYYGSFVYAVLISGMLSACTCSFRQVFKCFHWLSFD